MIAVEKGVGSAKLVGKSLDAAMRDCSSACIAALRKVGRTSSICSLLNLNV